VKETITVKGSVEANKGFDETDNIASPRNGGILVRAQVNPQEAVKFFKGQRVELSFEGEEPMKFPPLEGRVIDVTYDRGGSLQEYKPEVVIHVRKPGERVSVIQSEIPGTELMRNMQISLRTKRLLFILLSKGNLKQT
jgi:hypothetical protein